MSGKAKEKLPPIPRHNPRKARPALPGAPPDTQPVSAPDLAHIAPGLRSLAKPLADLAFLATNAVDHPDSQIEDLAAILAQRGQLEALVVNQRSTPPVVIGGNGRLRAMLSLGWTHAAWHAIDVDEATAEQISLELNGASDGRVYNAERLTAMLDRIKAAKVEMSARLAAMMERMRKEKGAKPAKPAQDVGAQLDTAMQHKIIIDCRDEAHQAELLDRFDNDGIICKALIV